MSPEVPVGERAWKQVAKLESVTGTLTYDAAQAWKQALEAHQEQWKRQAGMVGTPPPDARGNETMATIPAPTTESKPMTKEQIKLDAVLADLRQDARYYHEPDN